MALQHIHRVETHMETEPTRVDLGGDLAGHYVLLDPEELTFGFLEDIQSGQLTPILDALTLVILGSDVPKLAIDPLEKPEAARKMLRQGIRRLRVGEMKALLEGVGQVFAVPKS